MIVIGKHGLGEFGRHMLGAVSSGLLHHAHCPVAIVHETDSARREIRDDAPVLVGIDGSPASEAATALAFDEASRRRVPLIALHAWSDVGVFPILGMDWRVNRDEGDEVLGERLAGWQEIYPDVQVRRRLVSDVPARWLVNESEGAQLVVLGSRGRGSFDGLQLGSVSSAVAQSARVPVIATRAGGTVVTVAEPPKNQPHDGRAIFFLVEVDRAQLAGALRLLSDRAWLHALHSSYGRAEAKCSKGGWVSWDFPVAASGLQRGTRHDRC